jgi:hypothetical protein
MNRYGAWNPRGTSNSEYGRFNTFKNMQSPASQLMTGNQNQNVSWNSAGEYQQQCQNVHQGNYGQQNGHMYQNYYHHPSCPNSGKPQSQWMQQGQGEGAMQNYHQGAGMNYQYQQQGQDQNGSGGNFTIQVGEEAAAAALGGQANFHTHFSMPQNGGPPMTQATGMYQHQSQSEQDQGIGEGNVQQSMPQEIQSQEKAQYHSQEAPAEMQSGMNNDAAQAQGQEGQGDIAVPGSAPAEPQKQTQAVRPEYKYFLFGINRN